MRNFQAVEFPAGSTPIVVGQVPAEGETFLAGSPCILVDGELVECSTLPLRIDYIAGASPGTQPGKEAANNPLASNPQDDHISAYNVYARTPRFSAYLVNNSTVPIDPEQTDIGKSYGVVKNGIGWVVDKSVTGATPIQIVDIDEDRNFVIFKVLSPIVVSSITVAPTPVSVVNAATQQFTATVKDANGVTIPGASVTWSTTAGTGTGTINSTGLFTATGAGTVTVTATIGTVNGTAAVTVT